MTKAKTKYRISVTLRADQYERLVRQSELEHVPLALLIRRHIDRSVDAALTSKRRGK